MQKDVIYIDVEDDITAIIGKVKSAKEKVVALVPPKRIGVLQSAVNLRLLLRAANQSDKRLVLITNNQALVGLASSAQLPVAKNLQSKPEIPDIPALKLDDDDDIIDGEQLPVGDLADAIGGKSATAVPDNAVDDLDIDEGVPKRAVAPVAGAVPSRPRVKSGVKVPSFNTFRKRILFGGIGLVALVIFGFWAIVIAPHATVTITAQTSPQQVRTAVTLGDVSTNAAQGTLKSTTQQDKETGSVSFAATGTQQIGTKATGQMTITRTGVSQSPDTIPIGTGFSSGNYTFTTTATVTIPASSISGKALDHGSATVNVQAVDNGDSYNLAAQSYQSSLSGFSASGSQMSGGSSKTVQVVTQQDMMTAEQQLAQQNTDAIKKKLASKFSLSTVVIDSSFATSAANPVSSPAVGQQVADGQQAKLTQDTTYSLTGVDKNDLDTFLTAALQKTLTNSSQQRVYDTGVSSAQLTAFTQAAGSPAMATLSTTGQIGPMINDSAVKNQIKGKNYGDVQSSLRAISGVSDAVTHFSPFWVSTVPNDANKITIEFQLTNSSNGSK